MFSSGAGTVGNESIESMRPLTLWGLIEGLPDRAWWRLEQQCESDAIVYATASNQAFDLTDWGAVWSGLSRCAFYSIDK